jgi:PadR family transcriptional regulator, regulatory protein PadR
VRPGTVYRALRQMEGEGMVLSEHDGLDCRLSHRKYSITDSGEAYLELWANYLMECQKEVDLFFGAYSNGFVREAHG